MATRIQMWGNSLGVRIPKALAEQMKLAAGTRVEFAVRDGELVIRPSRAEPLRLEDLLAEITKRNLHSEIDSGGPLGRETW